MDEMSTENVSFCRQQIGCEPKVLGYHLLVKAYEPPEKLGSIYVPESIRSTSEARQNIGLVLSVGPDAFVEKNQSKKTEVGTWIHYKIIDRETIYANRQKCFYINDEAVISHIPSDEIHMFEDQRK